MAKYAVNYCVEAQYTVIVDADSYEEAEERWFDPAYWDSEPECVGEDLTDTDVYIEEIE
jgi:hypothetical protein